MPENRYDCICRMVGRYRCGAIEHGDNDAENAMAQAEAGWGRTTEPQPKKRCTCCGQFYHMMGTRLCRWCKHECTREGCVAPIPDIVDK